MYAKMALQMQICLESPLDMIQVHDANAVCVDGVSYDEMLNWQCVASLQFNKLCKIYKV